LGNNADKRYGVRIRGCNFSVKAVNISCATHVADHPVKLIHIPIIGEPVVLFMSHGQYGRTWDEWGTKRIFECKVPAYVTSSSLWCSPHCTFRDCDPQPESVARNKWVETYSIVYNGSAIDQEEPPYRNIEGLLGNAFVFRWFNNDYTGDFVYVDIESNRMGQILRYVNEMQQVYFSPLTQEFNHMIAKILARQQSVGRITMQSWIPKCIDHGYANVIERFKVMVPCSRLGMNMALLELRTALNFKDDDEGGVRTCTVVMGDTNDLKELLGMQKICEFCGTKRSVQTRLHKCARCNQKYYCSIECHTNHWPIHKYFCK